MSKAIYVSINALAVEKIINKRKNHEFRNYIPKKEFDTLYVYTTSPKSELKYILKINQIIKYPDKILVQGDGNSEFNNGQKSKFAYRIDAIYELENSFTLKELKECYGFVPPQAFAYGDRYQTLTEKLEQAKKIKR